MNQLIRASVRDGDLIRVEVPTERGSVCVIDIEHDRNQDSYRLEFSGELLDQAPEALTVSIQMALLTLRGTRRP